MQLPLGRAYTMNFFDAVANDCIEENSVDLVVTSPPYLRARKYKDQDEMKDEGVWYEFCFDVLACLKQLIKPSGVIWWNTGSGYTDNHKDTTIYELITTLQHFDTLYLIEDIPWCKTNFLPKTYSNRPYAAYEHNLIFCKNPQLVNYYVDHVREPYAESTLKRLEYPVGNLSASKDGEFNQRKMIAANPLGKSPPNYLLMSGDTTKRNHPAPMNPKVANWAIRAYSKEGDVVLDPMCGSGTTLIEAKKLGRQFIGFDVESSYVDMTNEALANVNKE